MFQIFRDDHVPGMQTVLVLKALSFSTPEHIDLSSMAHLVKRKTDPSLFYNEIKIEICSRKKVRKGIKQNNTFLKKMSLHALTRYRHPASACALQMEPTLPTPF